MRERAGELTAIGGWNAHHHAFVLYTEGLTEARSRAGMLGEERVREQLATLAGATAAGITPGLEELILGHSDAPRRGDIALLAMRVTP